MNHKAFLIALGAALATSTHAGDSIGKVGQILVGRMGSQVYVELVTTQYNGWPCTSIHPNGFRYAFLLSSSGAREILATVLAAQTSGKSLQVVGTGACTINTTMEDVGYVVLQP
mgnify:CR=1 FL=1